MMKLSRDQQFFYDKYISFAEELAKIGNRRILELLQQQKINKDLLLQQIAKVLLDYNIIDSILDINATEKIFIYNKFSRTIDKLIGAELKNELNRVSKTLVELGKDKWNSNNYLVSIGISTKLKKVDDKTLDKIIDKKIDGLKYSDRLYNNKQEVAKRLKQNVKDLLEGNITVNEIKDNLNKTYNLNAYNTKRLVSNEIARVNEGINNKWIEDNKLVQYVMWCATLENKTCSICGELDGKVWKKTEKHPTPLEDTHIGCRCCLVPLLNKDYRPSQRLDNETKDNIGWQTYKEWQDQQ